MQWHGFAVRRGASWTVDSRPGRRIRLGALVSAVAGGTLSVNATDGVFGTPVVGSGRGGSSPPRPAFAHRRCALVDAVRADSGALDGLLRLWNQTRVPDTGICECEWPKRWAYVGRFFFRRNWASSVPGSHVHLPVLGQPTQGPPRLPGWPRGQTGTRPGTSWQMFGAQLRIPHPSRLHPDGGLHVLGGRRRVHLPRLVTRTARHTARAPCGG